MSIRRFSLLLLLPLLAIFILPGGLTAQPVVGEDGGMGIGGPGIDPSALLDLQSTTRGFLMPRMTTAQRDAIENPAPGMIFYNTDLGAFQVNNGSGDEPIWETILTERPQREEFWRLGGNVTPPSNILGTLDLTDVDVRTNNLNAMTISAADQSVLVSNDLVVTGSTSLGDGGDNVVLNVAGGALIAAGLSGSSTSTELVVSNGGTIETRAAGTLSGAIGVASDATLNGDGTTATPLGINHGNSNTWTAPQQFDNDVDLGSGLGDDVLVDVRGGGTMRIRGLPPQSSASEVLVVGEGGVVETRSASSIGGSIVTDATLDGDGTGGSPLGIDHGNSNTWTAPQQFNGAVTLGNGGDNIAVNVGGASLAVAGLPGSSTSTELVVSNGGVIQTRAAGTLSGAIGVLSDVTLNGDGTTGSPLGINLANPNIWTATQTVNNGNLALTNSSGTAGEMEFYEPSGAGGNRTSFRAGAQNSDIFYTLPTTTVTGEVLGDALLQLNAQTGELSWISPSLVGGNDFWDLNGNSFTTPGTNYVGTRDQRALHIYVNGGSGASSNSFILDTNGSLYRDNNGDGRGSNAVDMQVSRTAAAQVASGQRAVIGGGYQNTASGDYATIPGGRGLTLSGNNSFGFLAGNSGSNEMSVAEANVFLFGNGNLWMANNTDNASQVRFYEPTDSTGNMPASDVFYTSFEAPSLGDTIEYILPNSLPIEGQFLTADDVTGDRVTLDWAWPGFQQPESVSEELPVSAESRAATSAALQDVQIEDGSESIDRVEELQKRFEELQREMRALQLELQALRANDDLSQGRQND